MRSLARACRSGSSGLLGANGWPPLPRGDSAHELTKLGEGDGALAVLLDLSGGRPGRVTGTVVYLLGAAIMVDEKDDEVIALTSHPHCAALRCLHLHKGA